MKMRSIFPVFLIYTTLLTWSCQSVPRQPAYRDYTIAIPVAGNSWVVGDVFKNQRIIHAEGIENWSDTGLKIRTYFRLERTGKLNVGFVAKAASERSVLRFSCSGGANEVIIKKVSIGTNHVGSFDIKKKGYHWVEVEGIEKTGATFPKITDFLIGGTAAGREVNFVKDDFYWGRRGPSVHLDYIVPENVGNVRWFYNEVTVPEDNDVLGSFFMADGFAQGYFGMQVNSSSERRILFSVWSPYRTDDPDEIPEEDRIVLLRKGKGVYAGEFGNEGSGGQSYLRFNWKAGNTYRFLLNATPTGEGETDFSAWFFAPESGEWRLIASFRRPKTDSYLTRLHSFLENFRTDTGDIVRKGLYSNQWVFGSDEQWTELSRARFTADTTARKGNRLDFAGGTENGSFFLKNCGFFSKTTAIDAYFTRNTNGIPPMIDFNGLP